MGAELVLAAIRKVLRPGGVYLHDERVRFRFFSLYCLLCGHQTAKMRLPIAGLTRTALRAALAAAAPETQPFGLARSPAP